MRTIFIIFLTGCLMKGFAQVPMDLAMLQTGQPTSIRGLSVVDDDVAWVSGSDGWIGRTTDHGLTWHWEQIAGYEAFDFRDIEAFSAEEAVAINAGAPLVILRTSDGGRTWRETYRDGRPAIFFDGIDFWDDRRGIAYGDPIDGVLQLLVTDDGGVSWRDVSTVANLRPEEGEAGFAASGTGIRTWGDDTVFIASGGTRARLFYSVDGGMTWAVNDCPMVQGTASTGIFSIAFRDEMHGVAVGGDYQHDKEKDGVVFLTADGGKTWAAPQRGTNGFRSAVEYVGRDTLIATGTSGVDVSFDGGQHWHAVSGNSFHAVRKAKHGSWVVLAGGDGHIATITGMDEKD